MIKKTVLIVEGQDDEHVVKNICGSKSLGSIHTIYKCGGREPLLEAVGVRLRESDVTNLGIILDADESVEATWRSVSNRLKENGYHVPGQPGRDGTVLDSPDGTILPRVGIWIMPNNQVPGILEDFLRFLIPEDDVLAEHATRAIAGLPQPLKFQSAQLPKAMMHTWLAWQADPGRPLGQAITRRYLNPNLPVGRSFVDWLNLTFFDDNAPKLIMHNLDSQISGE